MSSTGPTKPIVSPSLLIVIAFISVCLWHIADFRTGPDSWTQKKLKSIVRSGYARSHRKSVETLMKDFKSPDRNKRYSAARQVSRFGVDAEFCVPELKLLLRDPDPYVRYAAAFSLAGFNVLDRWVIDNIIGALNQGNPKLQLDAINALRGRYPFPSETIPFLIHLSKSNEKEVQQASMEVLAYAQSDDPRISEALKRGLKEKDEKTRQMAVISLMHREPQSVSLQQIKTALNNPDRDVRFQAINSLDSSHLLTNKEVEQILLERLKDKDDSVREAATRMIYRTSLGEGMVVDLLIKQLQDKSKWVRRTAAGGLAIKAGASEKAIPALTELAQSETDRSWARKTIAQIEKAKKR